MSKRALLILSLVSGCTCRGTPRSTEADAGRAPLASSGLPGAAPWAEDSQIHPVYPVDAGAPHPLAAKFCDAVLGLPIRRQAECCGDEPGFSAAGECVRTLTHALVIGAVELSPAGVERCGAEAARGLMGCDWVGASPAEVPAACRELVRGTLGAGSPCRSSLECSAGLNCHGLSATRKGVCGKPRPEGAPCGGGIDTLAAYTAQARIDTEHPECDGAYCSNGRCRAFAAAGAGCTGNAQCGPDASCRSGRCSGQPLPGAGERCANNECAPGNRCVRGVCGAPKQPGEPCDLDAECRGACLRQGGSAGRCTMRCPAFSIPTAAPSAKRPKLERRRHRP